MNRRVYGVFGFHPIQSTDDEPAGRKSVHPASVDWTARQIQNPVCRLRYLQSVAPAQLEVSRWKSSSLIGLVTISALGLVVAASCLRSPGAALSASPTLPPLPPIPRVELAAPSAEVWPVEKTPDFETYSNGLRIENQYAARHRPRAYLAFPMANPEGPTAKSGPIPRNRVPYHRESPSPVRVESETTC